MSQEAEIMFEMERARREKLFQERVRNKTQEFYQRYLKQYDDMIAQAYSEYIPNEMRRFKQDLDTIGNFLQSNPVSARQVSQEVGSYIHSLWSLGREAQKTFQETTRLEHERQKQEQAQRQNETLAHYYNVLSKLDSITANFATNEFITIKENISTGKISSIEDLELKLQPIIATATQKATEWKEKKQAEQSQQNAIAQIEEQKEIIQAEKFEDKSKAKAILDKLEEIKARTRAGALSREEVAKQITEINEETDSALVDESVRREMVKAIYKWFNAHDFTVSKPRLIEGAVVLTAQRPSGNKAQFKLTLDNKMFYRLDGYEGQSCLKDITSAKANWESVYGFEFRDEIIKKQNPDRILHKQNRTFSSKGGNM